MQRMRNIASKAKLSLGLREPTTAELLERIRKKAPHLPMLVDLRAARIDITREKLHELAKNLRLSDSGSTDIFTTTPNHIANVAKTDAMVPMGDAVHIRRAVHVPYLMIKEGKIEPLQTAIITAHDTGGTKRFVNFLECKGVRYKLHESNDLGHAALQHAALLNSLCTHIRLDAEEKRRDELVRKWTEELKKGERLSI